MIVTSQITPMFGQLLNLGHWSTDGLIFYWRGIEAGEVVDESYYRNNGTIVGATWTTQGLSFSGNIQYVSAGSLEQLGSSWFPYTVILVARRDALGNPDGVYNLSSNRHQLFVYSDGDFAYGDSSTSANWERLSTSNAWTDTTQFHQIAVRSVSPTQVDFFFDAQFVGSLTSSFVQQFPLDKIEIGRMDSTQDSIDFDGEMKLFIIYNRALSANEIAALYLNPDLPMQQPPIWLLQPPVVGAVPKGPLGHPLYGPFAGPIAC